MKKIILLLVTLISFNVSNAQNWNKISKEIRKQQETLLPTDKNSIIWFFLKSYEELRIEYIKNIDIDINTSSDTIYILENQTDGHSLECRATIWNKKGFISYISFPNDSVTFYETPLFTRFMMGLVEEWDIPEIRKEEKENGESIPVYYEYATRIIFNNKKYRIDCIRFKSFFNLDRGDSFLY